MIVIDGSMGEGGGQVLRTALSLSAITGEPMRITNIRAKRRKPGLMRQHLTAVKAAAEVSGAEVNGDSAGSTELEFKPGRTAHGTYAFPIGTAGSATLVLQTVLPILLSETGHSFLTLEGGTHNPLAPPFDFLDRAFLPILERMGAKVSARLHRYGFYPAGGGKISVDIEGGALKPLFLGKRDGEAIIKAVCLIANLNPDIAQRETTALKTRLPQLNGKVDVQIVDSPGPGNAVVVDVATPNVNGAGLTEVFTSIGERGTSAERVAGLAASDANEYLRSGAAVGKHLADQLLLPMAIAGGGEFTTLEPSLHSTTNMEVIGKFLPVTFFVHRGTDGLHVISCKG